MNVLFYTNSFLPKKDGVTFRLKQWIDHWDKNDKLFVATTQPQVVSSYEGVQEIIQLSGVNFFTSVYPEISHANYFKPWALIRQLREIVCQYSIDVLHVVGPEFLIGTFLSYVGVPLYLSYHTNVVQYMEDFLNNRDKYSSTPLAYWPCYFLYKMRLLRFFFIEGSYKQIFFPSTYLQEVLMKQYVLKKKDLNRISTLSPIIRHDIFYPDSTVQKDFKTLLFVGRLAVEKNIGLLFEILKYLKGYTLWIVGGGTMKPYLEQLAQEQTDNTVVFLGEKNQKDIVPYYQRAGFFINPSQTETLGFTTIEAMACRTVVIVYPKGGTLSLVEEGKTGLFFRTAQEGAEQVQKLEQDRKLYEQIVECACQQVQNYSPSSNVNMLRSFYLQSLSQHT